MEQGIVLKTWKTKKERQAVIRSIRESDFDDLLTYANALVDEDTYIMLSGEHLTVEEERRYLDDTLTKMAEGKKIHLIVEVEGVFAGSCEVRFFDRRKRHVGEIGISLAKPYREEGIGSRCLEVLIGEAKKAGLRLLYLHALANNPRALHVYEKLGFVRSGTLPGAYEYKGSFVGEVTLYLPLV